MEQAETLYGWLSEDPCVAMLAVLLVCVLAMGAAFLRLFLRLLDRLESELDRRGG